MSKTYEQRLIRVLDYIHANPNGDLSLDALADVAAMSRFHWHRVYLAMTGETCAEAIRRIRLHRGAVMLVQSNKPIAEIAEAVGYENARSFTRAFRVAYGRTPGAFRKRGELAVAHDTRTTGERPMIDVKIEDRPTRRLAGTAHQGAYHEIGNAFQKIAAVFSARNLWPEAGPMIGIYYDDPSTTAEADLTSHAGVTVSDGFEMPDALDEVRITGGRTAVYVHKGSYADLPNAWNKVYGDWLPESGEEPANLAPYEVYLNDPMNTAPDDLLTEICVPLKG